MSDNNGSSLLTEGAEGGNPAPQLSGELNAAQQALADAQEFNEIPDYVPPKFWDKTTGKPKVEDLGRSYLNLEKLLGREKVPVPVDDGDDEGWNRWYAAMGRPEAPDKYEFQRPDLPQGMDYDEDLEKDFRNWAHENGLNKRQANRFYDRYVKRHIEARKHYEDHQKQSRARIETDMRREYGNQYEGAVSTAKSAVQKYTDPDFRAWLDETGLGNDPRLIRVFARIGKEMQGETRLKGAPQAEANSGDLDMAIANFRDKYKDALWNKDHPNHDIRNKELRKLYEQRFPEQK